MGAEIEVEELAAAERGRPVWFDLSATFPADQISVVLGPSGSGTSTLLEVIGGLSRPARGRVHVDGERLTARRARRFRRDLGILTRDGCITADTVYDNVALPLRAHTKCDERTIHRIVTEKLGWLGIAGLEQRNARDLSLAARKRVALARALVVEPGALLLDHPSAGLDPVRAAFLLQTLVDVQARTEATFIVATDDIAEALSLADRIVLLFRGSIAAAGNRDDLLGSADPVVRQLLDATQDGPIAAIAERDATAAERAALRRLARLPDQGDPYAGMPAAEVAEARIPRRTLPSPGFPVSERWERIIAESLPFGSGPRDRLPDQRRDPPGETGQDPHRDRGRDHREPDE